MASDPQQAPSSIRFGEDFELDRAAYQLRRAGRRVKLERIPLEILLLLADRRGQLVTREEIAERIWGKDAFLDVDNSINGAIRKIRQVLKDDSEQPQFVQTITGRGYCFVAPVLPADSLPSSPATSMGLARARRGVTLLLARRHRVGPLGHAAPRDGRVMLAVLPFQNLTGDEGQEYLSDGLTEEMIAQLGNRDPTVLGVIAPTSVMQYKNSQAPPQRIARELSVQYVLTGSVRRDSSTVRVTAHLVRASDQAQLWAQEYDRQLTGLLTLQGELARRSPMRSSRASGTPCRPRAARRRLPLGISRPTTSS